MKLMVFGSMNIDHVYHLSHFVREGETLSSLCYERNEGGKGFNQAIALAKAGQKTWFAGAIGQEGIFLKTCLEDLGIHTEDVQTLKVPTGYAMIQVDAQGRNSIILYGGANQCVSPKMMAAALSRMEAGDALLMQNEISCGDGAMYADRTKRLRQAAVPVQAVDTTAAGASIPFAAELE